MMPRSVFPPGSTIGVMGSGQLGRMLAVAARRMGYRFHVYSPERGTPAGQLADLETAAPYEDRAAVEDFAKGVDVLTFEFENIPVQSVEWAAAHCVTRPSGNVLHLCQHRLREKQFLAGAGIPVAPFAPVASAGELKAALEKIGTPSILKTAAFGYDGKGQRKILSAEEAGEVTAPSVLEGFVPFEKEISVIVARGTGGETATFPVCENIHRNHILDITIAPARVSDAVEKSARELACLIAGKLDLAGLLAVEMFLLPDSSLVVNELAPRPHNSGHYTFDACVTSQFEQQLRAVCGLPLGSTELLRPAAMVNLLGDLWAAGEPDWAAAAAFPAVKIHVYGKSGPKPGRKMGHLTALAPDIETAIAMARDARASL
ncbi:MAG TPA: 5-(carboxyamino)imidazole ribonucleotide synthase [Chthoniobacteraceae bacterium]|jgi:5-(carboxyamino)imidazole ribonucleotide synthase|nr:5-(carboxyamino)imidazole ribonucleotide synthase [Chthoniobacteraceae bacterium]